MAISKCKIVYSDPKKYMDTFGKLHHTEISNSTGLYVKSVKTQKQQQNHQQANAKMLTASKTCI